MNQVNQLNGGMNAYRHDGWNGEVARMAKVRM